MNNLIKIEEVAIIMSDFPAVVSKNATSVDKCNDAGQTLLDTIESIGGMNEQIDQAIEVYLQKVKVTVTNMNDRRKPFTQIFDRIRSSFTAQEKEIDLKEATTIPGQLLIKRNQYATWKYQEEEKRKKLAEQTARIDNEKASYKRDLESAFLEHFNAYLNAERAKLTNLFNAIALPSFDRDSNAVLLFSLDYPRSQFDKFAREIATYYIDQPTKQALRTEVLAGKYEVYSQLLKQHLQSLRQEYIDRFGSLRKELEEIEALKQSDAKAAQEAEDEKKKREAEALAAQLLANKAREEEQKRVADQSAQTASMQSLFTSAAASMPIAPANAKVKEKITVLHPAGIIEAYNMWWLGEGINLPIDELEKIHKKMIAYCEKQANAKEPQHITSQYIRYEKDITAK